MKLLRFLKNFLHIVLYLKESLKSDTNKTEKVSLYKKTMTKFLKAFLKCRVLLYTCVKLGITIQIDILFNCVFLKRRILP